MRTTTIKTTNTHQIAYIEPDATLSLPQVLPSTPTNPRRTTQTNAPWNLARISHRARGSTDYVYLPTSGVSIYVIDTGIMTSHQVFAGRATNVYNAVGGGTAPGDNNGHGTFIAGIAAGNIYGVARPVSIYGVKALQDSGSTTSMYIHRSLLLFIFLTEKPSR